MILSLEKIINKVNSELVVPIEWQVMEIKSIHKKGSKLDLRNKRGLFLTNNVSKVHERTIKNRNDHDFRKGISSWQTGGIKNRSTSDNTLITTSIMEQNKYLVKETIIACTDAEKCFDNL